jgi:hypothetical protein
VLDREPLEPDAGEVRDLDLRQAAEQRRDQAEHRGQHGLELGRRFLHERAVEHLDRDVGGLDADQRRPDLRRLTVGLIEIEVDADLEREVEGEGADVALEDEGVEVDLEVLEPDRECR